LTSAPQICEGEYQKIVHCEKLLPCPEDENENEKEGVCQDIASDCSAKVVRGAGRKECRQSKNNKWMNENCKKTCMFCDRKYVRHDNRYSKMLKLKLYIKTICIDLGKYVQIINVNYILCGSKLLFNINKS